MQALPSRVLSGRQCSTSSEGRIVNAPVPVLVRWRCLAGAGGSSDAGPQPRNGWMGNACHLQRRPSPPQILANNEREPLAIGLQPVDLPPSVMSRNGSNGAFPDFFDSTIFVAETLLPTQTGKYRLRGYRHSVDGGRTYTEPSVIMTGSPEGQENVPLRVHDACFTSEVLGSLKCDCADQLDLAMEYIQTHAPGIIIYLQQEGRGIGLANKIAAYALQEEGLDTVDANRALGLPDDCREYTSVRNILADLGVKSVQLMTNNPRKIRVLEELGVAVTARIPCIVQAQAHSLGYLATKRARMSHLIEQQQLDGSFCHWNHDGEPLKPSSAAPLKLVEPDQPLISRPGNGNNGVKRV